MLTTDQNKAIVRAAAGQPQQGKTTLVTTDTTLTDACVAIPGNLTAGYINVTVIATNLSGDTYVGVKQVGYQKLSDVVTLLGSVATIFENVALTGASFAIVADAESLKVQVTGVGEQVKWVVKVDETELFNDLTEPL